MYKVLWAIVALAAIALGTAVLGALVNNNDVRAQSAEVSAISHQESVDRGEIARLRAEVESLAGSR